MQPIIRSIEAIPVELPLTEPFESAFGVRTTADLVLIRILDSDGVTGVAEATPRLKIYGETTGSIVSLYERVLNPMFCGRSVWDRERYWNELDDLIGNHTAKAAFDMALADLDCRRLGISCHQYLGGYTRELQITALVGMASPDVVVDRVQHLRETFGIKCFKLKVGHDLPNDVTTVRRVREEQPDALIYVDANRAYDAMTALEFCRLTADMGVSWIEEPIPAESLFSRARFVEQSPLAVLGDESCTTPAEVAREVVAGRTSIVSMKIARQGYTGSDRIRGFCESSGIPIVPGAQGESGIGVLTSMAYLAAYKSTSQYPAEHFISLADDLLTERVHVSGGKLTVRDSPGNGVEIDEDKLRKYKVS